MTVPGSATAEQVQAESRAGFWFARLSRPQKRNALSPEMLDQLGRLFDRVAADPDARALVIWGGGGHFCAGADVTSLSALLQVPAGEAGDPLALHNRAFGSLLERLDALAVPTVGVVCGAVVGGGCGLAAACDRVIACESATFSMPEVTLGVVPAQIAPFIVRRAGPTAARWLLISGQVLSAADAATAGLADVVVPLTGLADALRATLRGLTRSEPGAVRATLQLVNRTLEQPTAAVLDAGSLEFARLLRHGRARAGLAAARDRRSADWHCDLPDLPELN